MRAIKTDETNPELGLVVRIKGDIRMSRDHMHILKRLRLLKPFTGNSTEIMV